MQGDEASYAAQNAWTSRRTPEEAIKGRLSEIDRELAQFSEDRRKALLSERARLLKAGEALGMRL